MANLQLLEAGKLTLDDEITRFLPDYPTQGQTITIEHLLTHTSGIKSYAILPEWLPLWRKDISMEFAPSGRFNYCNSGYILLGAIIETLSGLQAYQGKTITPAEKVNANFILRMKTG